MDRPPNPPPQATAEDVHPGGQGACADDYAVCLTPLGAHDVRERTRYYRRYAEAAWDDCGPEDEPNAKDEE